MKKYKILSFLLALLFIFSAIPATVLADDDDTQADTEITETTETVDNTDDADDPDADNPDADEEGEEGDLPAEGEKDYLREGYETREAKLADMEAVFEQDGYRIWYEDYTGEVVIEQIDTGEFLFSNPYDISAKNSKVTNEIKKHLLSQIKLTYLDKENSEKEGEMYSFTDAAMRNQIHLKYIKNGIRVEYILGEDAIQRLVPRMISVERFQKFILDPLNQAIAEGKPGAEFTLKKINSFFEEKNIDKATSERAVKDMIAAFPIVKRMAVYVCDASIPAARLKELEQYVKEFCPQYTYEELQYDNEETGYVNTDAAPPRFTMALEYTVTEDGVQVRLPANGISFDEEAYPLKTVSILPYMGAGSSAYDGYTFYPDGSGTIIKFSDVKDSGYLVSGQVYGPDYAYHEIKTGNEEVLRMPVFGVVTNYSKPVDPNMEEEKIYPDSGFLAIITEGDSMATISSEHGGTLYGYNHVYATFTPRPSDTYDLSDSISVSGNSKFTVTSERRYTGSYTIKYVMLNEKEGEEKGYEPSYVGMAKAYRDYLYDNGTLTKLEADGDVPLFIESFGSIETVRRILSIPINVDAPLTTFDNVIAMCDNLREQGIENVNFKLIGFANGGLISTMPYKLKWVGALGGSKGFDKLVEYAEKNNIGVYPDFDFAYMEKKESFDGVNLKKHAVRTIDNRYVRKKDYDPATQAMEYNPTMSMTAISPKSFDYFYSKFTKNYSKFGNSAISMSSLGSDLNSDFNKKDPYHREDSKEVTAEVLEKAGEEYDSVMVSGGNAYSYKYADVITDISLASSGYINSSAQIPFVGMVLHGSKVFTGTPLNMEGDIRRAILDAIENGATINFTLSYQNTDKLKDNEYWRQYYSVAFDIWSDDVIKYYDIVNEALKDVQEDLIVDHGFLAGKRVPDEDEKEADRLAEEKAAEEQAEQERIDAEKAEKRRRRYERLGIPDPGSSKNKTVPAPAVDPNKYNTPDDSIVRVEYEGGTTFILNYNSYDVTVEYEGQTYEIEAMGFAKIG